MSRIAARRFELFTDADDEAWKALNVFCTMRAMTNICMIPKAIGKGWKFPKLGEAYYHATQTELPGAHESGADNEASRVIYWWLKKQG